MNTNINLTEGSSLQGGKYRVIRMLGRGGFGITYQVFHTLLNKVYALKEFFPQDYCNRDSSTSHVKVATDGNRELVDRLRTRFISEARNIAGLRHHNIIGIHDVFEENGTAYFVMDYIDGLSLEDMVAERGALPVDEAVRYTLAIASALDYLHASRMTHYDVKPANIMVRSDDGTPVLIDFGLSKQYNDSGHSTSTLLVGLSHGYSALEQYSNDGVATFSPRADVYSLGATLYTLLTGAVPVAAPSRVGQEPVLPPHIPEHIRRAVAWAMVTDANHRCPSAKAFAEALTGQPVATEQPQSAPQGQATQFAPGPGYSSPPTRPAPPTPQYAPTPAPSGQSKSPWLYVMLGAVGVFLLVFIILMLSGGGSKETVVDTVVTEEVAAAATETEPATPTVEYISLNGTFYYDGGTYPFTLSFSYNNATGAATSPEYKASGSSLTPKITDITYTGDHITVTGPETYIEASGSPESGFSGEMRRVDHYGTCELTL